LGRRARVGGGLEPPIRAVNGTDNFHSESASVFKNMVCEFSNPTDIDAYRLHEIDKKRFDKIAPTAAEWEKALTLCRCLKKFDDLTTLLSGNKYPTTNLFYKGFCEIKALISGWNRSSHATIKNMAASMQTKFDKYWHKSNLALAVAFFLDPRYKRSGIEHYMRKVNGDLLYRSKVEELLIIVKKMYLAYALTYSQSTTGPNSTATAQKLATDFMEEEEDDYFRLSTATMCLTKVTLTWISTWQKQ
jgi:hypothetical protein